MDYRPAGWRRTPPDLHGNLRLPAWLTADEQLWLVIPLLFRDRVEVFSC